MTWHLIEDAKPSDARGCDAIEAIIIPRARDLAHSKWPGDRITVRAKTAACFVIFGDDPMDGPRHLWCSFVSSRPERIEQGKADWRQACFDTALDDSEFIALPDA